MIDYNNIYSSIRCVVVGRKNESGQWYHKHTNTIDRSDVFVDFLLFAQGG